MEWSRIKACFHAEMGSQTVFLGKAPGTNRAAATALKIQPSFLRLLSNSTTTSLTGPVSCRKSNGFLEQACRHMGSCSLVILHVGLAGEARHDVLHAQPVPAQHAV